MYVLAMTDWLRVRMPTVTECVSHAGRVTVCTSVSVKLQGLAYDILPLKKVPDSLRSGARSDCASVCVCVCVCVCVYDPYQCS